VFREIDLYLSIASLSYIGDPRMLYGENPRKVVNLVMPVVPMYRETYKDVLNAFTIANKPGVSVLRHIEDDPENTLFSQDVSIERRWQLAQVHECPKIYAKSRILFYASEFLSHSFTLCR
jgi:mitochondrial translocator assembly and maintenance protein 41